MRWFGVFCLAWLGVGHEAWAYILEISVWIWTALAFCLHFLIVWSVRCLEVSWLWMVVYLVMILLRLFSVAIAGLLDIPHVEWLFILGSILI